MIRLSVSLLTGGNWSIRDWSWCSLLSWSLITRGGKEEGRGGKEGGGEGKRRGGKGRERGGEDEGREGEGRGGEERGGRKCVKLADNR